MRQRSTRIRVMLLVFGLILVGLALLWLNQVVPAMVLMSMAGVRWILG